jgi:hypothetical protein
MVILPDHEVHEGTRSPHVLDFSSCPSSYQSSHSPSFLSTSIPTGSLELRKQGYLTKQGKIVKNWKRRWFQLEQYQDTVLLSYYRYPEDGKPRGRIVLVDYLDPDTCTATHTHRRLCFRLRDSNRIRDFYICADTEAEMHDWMNIISGYTLHMV